MANAVVVGGEQGIWSVGGHSTVIEYSLPVLARINSVVIEGFRVCRRGGVEVGGVLFGVRQGERVVIEAFRPLTCEYAAGPNFVLSEKDHTAFAELLKSAESAESSRSLIPVGWYHSHTRTQIHLSKQDLEIHERYFPEMSGIALVLRPEDRAPTRAGFFFRESDGCIHSESSYLEFEAPTIQIERPAHSDGPAQSDRQAALRIEAPVAPLAALAVSYKSVPLEEQPRPLGVPAFLESPVVPKSRKWLYYAMALLGISLFGGYFVMARNSPSSGPLSLKVEEVGGRLRIGW
ncbi:MAG: hypothetical protein ABIZ80_11440, partial [Bryobacteraceae bacterium]